MMVRALDKGMGEAVARRTVFRTSDGGSWRAVAERVSAGNCSLHASGAGDVVPMARAIASGSLLMSGRHLQHGDVTQPKRAIEVMTNCFDGATKVATMEFGAVPLRSIVGKTVTVRALDGQWRPALVSAHGRRDLRQITLVPATGAGHVQHVRATPDHRWILRGGAETTRLAVGDVLAAPIEVTELEPEAIRHGLIFGDGSAHKHRIEGSSSIGFQGREYASIRLCGNDKDFLKYFDAGTVTYPPHANGDPVVYLGRKNHWKDLPFTNDPAYLAGFVKGWWLADGAKGLPGSIMEISTTRSDAVEWLFDHVAYIGMIVTSHRVVERTDGDGSYAHGKPLHVVRLRTSAVKVKAIEEVEADETFCLEEPVTHGFYLANGVPTGNCSTAATSFGKFYLLLNGSGVGRSYDDQMMVVDWQKGPRLILALSVEHADFPRTDAALLQFAKDWEFFQKDGTPDVKSATLLAYSFLYEHQQLDGYRADPEHYVVFDVPDSREGWADAIELMEWMAFNGDRRQLVVNWSGVRGKGQPIGGMQDRPASGPLSPMRGMFRIFTQVVVAEPMPKWRQAMIVDHHLSVEVQVGGARRAARMSTKDWKDPDVIDFIYIKSRGGLWTSNNSVMVDAEFWSAVRLREARAMAIFNAIAECSYINGEPGLINGDKLQAMGTRQVFTDGSDFRSDRYSCKYANGLLAELAVRAQGCRFQYITNPCGEIVLHILGAYCVIADVAPLLAFPGTIEEAVALRTSLQNGGGITTALLSDEPWVAIFGAWDAAFMEAALIATRALIRVNLMPALYQQEVKRTNRIGIGLTGIHEYAWLRFGLTFDDMLSDSPAAKAFWAMLKKVSNAIKVEATRYSLELDVAIPHTALTIKPAGTTSKLFGLTEGAHLAALVAALRWVQFRNDDPLVAEYAAKGYPTKELKSYAGMTIVGFPLVPLITRLGMPWVTTASDAPPQQQYQYIRLLEKHWLGAEMANQVSYTMKIMTDKFTLDEYKQILEENQPTVKCCTVLPQKPAAEMGYEYLPEQEMPLADLLAILDKIQDPEMIQALDMDSLKCSAGACPI